MRISLDWTHPKARPWEPAWEKWGQPPFPSNWGLPPFPSNWGLPPFNGTAKRFAGPQDVGLGQRQLDLVFGDFDGSSAHRSVHIPFDAAAGVVTVIPPTRMLKSLGHAKMRMQLLAVENASERVLAEYIFNHAPYDART